MRQHLHPRGAARETARGPSITPIQIPPDVADDIADSAAATATAEAEQRRREALAAARPATPRRAVASSIAATTTTSSGKISEEFWKRQVAGVGGGAADASKPNWDAWSSHGHASLVTGREDFRTRETGRISLQNAGSGRTAPIARNGAIELHVRSRNSLSYLQLSRSTCSSKGNETGNWRRGRDSNPR